MARYPRRDRNEDKKGRGDAHRREGSAKPRAALACNPAQRQQPAQPVSLPTVADPSRDELEEGDEDYVGGAHEGAVAKTCDKELAELYEERLRETGLTVSIEPTR
jgi:hypothetical protein